MKFQSLFFIFFFLSFSFCKGQVQIELEKEDYYFPKITKKNSSYKFPTGTVKLNDSIYIDATPVDNLMYLEFYYNVKNFWTLAVSDSLKKIPKSSVDKNFMKKHFELFPVDSILFLSISPNNNSLAGNQKMENYFSHPKYSHFPIINITKEQAELFCKWRTDMVSLALSVRSKNIEERKSYPNKFIYRLPTKKEFESAISKFGFSKNKYKRDDNIPLFQLRNSYKKKYKKAYFYKSNVSEYTLDNNPIGSNWRNENDFTKFNDYTGFRCVCEIID